MLARHYRFVLSHVAHDERLPFTTLLILAIERSNDLLLAGFDRHAKG